MGTSLAGLPSEQRMIDRATVWPAPGNGNIRIRSAADLVVLKSFADRPPDWIDVEKIIIRQRDLNRELVTQELSPLVQLKEEPEIMENLHALFAKHH